ncbi:unnamed protein product [Psylliodes chrysocephalus]|uniref:Uncharacterized protein n=1 Tax=Psylliodes chrysocephalus TaxID=3402493 RepID=A0A9P0GGN5_9CUCU|nr:unnamed protein product [Psylliodes chrysocephala]
MSLVSLDSIFSFSFEEICENDITDDKDKTLALIEKPLNISFQNIFPAQNYNKNITKKKTVFCSIKTNTNKGTTRGLIIPKQGAALAELCQTVWVQWTSSIRLLTFRLWFKLLITFSFLSITMANTRMCKCWDGYRVDFGKNGPQCVAMNQYHIMPCNMIKSPKCKCSGVVSNILKDRTGTWCTRYNRGKELKRWPCENIEEWDDFFRKHPDFI